MRVREARLGDAVELAEQLGCVVQSARALRGACELTVRVPRAYCDAFAMAMAARRFSFELEKS